MTREQLIQELQNLDFVGNIADLDSDTFDSWWVCFDVGDVSFVYDWHGTLKILDAGEFKNRTCEQVLAIVKALTETTKE